MCMWCYEHDAPIRDGQCTADPDACPNCGCNACQFEECGCDCAACGCSAILVMENGDSNVFSGQEARRLVESGQIYPSITEEETFWHISNDLLDRCENDSDAAWEIIEEIAAGTYTGHLQVVTEVPR